MRYASTPAHHLAALLSFAAFAHPAEHLARLIDERKVSGGVAVAAGVGVFHRTGSCPAPRRTTGAVAPEPDTLGSATEHCCVTWRRSRSSSSRITRPRVLGHSPHEPPLGPSHYG